VFVTDSRIERKIEAQQKSYQAYAHAAELYGKMPTLDNWERKEKALEQYNALIQPKSEAA
jgi:hypothetical protein